MDREERLLRMEGLDEFIPEISEFISSHNIGTIPCGSYRLPKGIYVNIECYVTQPRERREFESHRRYVDLQCVISGKETISVCDRDTLRPKRKYERASDTEFYANQTGADYVLEAGDCMLLYPNNAHMPCVRADNIEVAVRKAVFKIPIHYFSDIKCLVMDVDGTLTDGKVYMDSSGEAMKAFNIKDGYGISTLLPALGICPVVITGRKSEITLRRCRELGIGDIYQGISDKVGVILKVISEKGIDISGVAYIGDDMNDLACMEEIRKGGGIVACPSDAVDMVKEAADFIACLKGGDGAVRDFIDWMFD